jgi:hypothetical protein
LNLPSRSYLDTVIVGYEAAEFDLEFIDEALEISNKAIQKYPPKYI